MGRTNVVGFVAELQHSSTPETQIAALKQLKNGVIGHTEKKGGYVRHGIVAVLAQTLQNADRSRGKRRDQVSNGIQGITGKPHGLGGEDEVRLQALLLLGSITQGGPEFVGPIIAGGIIPLLIDALSPSQNPPRIVAASLKNLLYLAEADRYASPRSESLLNSPVMDTLYSTTTVQVFAEILMQRAHTSAVQAQLSFLSRFINATCVADFQCNALVGGGVLDLLGARMAAYHMHQRYFPVRLHPTSAAALPPPPSEQILPHVMSAIAAITNRSRYRVARLLYSPPVLTVFPFHKPDVLNETSGNSTLPGGGLISPVEFRLPHLQQKSENGFSRNFPALGSHASARQSVLADLMETGPNGVETGPQYGGLESSLITWLLNLVRAEHGLQRLHAAELLASISVSGFMNKSRDRMLAYLMVPLLLPMLDEKNASAVKTTPSKTVSDSWIMKEKAPVVLKTLLEKNLSLQKAAVDAGALKQVGNLLKQSFEPLEPRPPVWPVTDSDSTLSTELSPSCTLGPVGLQPYFVHALKCRTGALLLLAAIADKEDKYRKQFTENGIVSNIVDSLSPFKEEILAEIEAQAYSANKEKIQPAVLGNNVEVLLAACSAARALTRSIGLLRTSLIDAGLAKPIFALLKHPSVSVVKAATDVVCNIITDFSPMREDLIEAGAIKRLCEHAHSADSTLRLVSLWALKHLMLKSPNDVKISCFEELGTGWLIQMINGGVSSASSSTSSRTTKPVAHQPIVGMGAANAAGERIDILNAVDDEPMDTAEDGVVVGPLNDNYGDNISASPADSTVLIPDVVLNFLLPSTSQDVDIGTISSQYRARLHTFKEASDRAVAAQAYADELRIQSQGLDFIRNMIFPPKAGDMIDSIFQTLGVSTLFDIVGSKFRWSTPAQDNAAAVAAAASPSQDARRELIESAVKTLVHIAAGEQRHRQQLISQPSLLRALLPLLSHSDSAIRVACLWVLINLTWCDSEPDRPAARQRALELRKLGFEEKLRDMGSDDVIDVRQRVATARDQISDLLDGVGSAGSGRGVGSGITGR